MTPALDIPVLETERLRLRAPCAADAAAFEAFFTSGRSKFVGGPVEPGRPWRILAAHVGQWALNGFGMWVVTARGDDAALGLVGCWAPGDWPEPELGWQMFEGAEGRGFAFEAAQAARRCAYGRFGWTTAVSYIDPDNARSRRLADRLGCVVEPDAPTPRGEPLLVYRHPAPEALAP
ncbi:GNAT family N-acetyltransferase [Rubrimonas cliftonensis]|uniref:Protein N-acetyltransferase, RimJ/RimL family n=1 Tax=Rubrimonas cliftonensis TaxID=89524 RepID=A0A1H3VI75_9RHOB|nr:GNAT family N-acetyltransferase [Rubrimonas cliftonensis]SDZ73812.1 Protein N-acetyltransferase, RimJ/RimL family [Rubrimonas cliftonensis]